MKNKSFDKVGYGLIIGVLVGVVVDNVGLGIALGLLFGVYLSSNKNDEEENKENK